MAKKIDEADNSEVYYTYSYLMISNFCKQTVCWYIVIVGKYQ